MAKLQEQQKIPQPVEIPADFVEGPNLNWDRIEEVLGIDTGEGLGAVLRYLYFTEPTLNYRINVSLLRLAIDQANGKVHLPVLPPDYHESTWMAADNGCEHCPGSIVIEHLPGFHAPQCLNFNRAEKYEDCLKYREALEKHVITDEDIANATNQVAKRLQQLVQLSKPADHITLAAEVVARIAGDPQ